jgi:hypothetical protein
MPARFSPWPPTPSAGRRDRRNSRTRRIESTNAFISPAVWKACSEPVGSLEGLALYGGLDLSEVADLTALVLIGWRHANILAAGRGLAEKGAADRVPYNLWRAQGYLEATPGKTVSYEYVANHLCRLVPALPHREDRIRPVELPAFPALAAHGRSDRAVRQRAFRGVGQGMLSSTRSSRSTRPATASPRRSVRPAASTGWWRWRWRSAPPRDAAEADRCGGLDRLI